MIQIITNVSNTQDTGYMLALFVCLFDSLRPINNLSVKQERVFLG